jgi:hypothetical protein
MLAEWTIGSTFWTLVAFFFWFMFLWMFITVFADIFRRRDLSGFGNGVDLPYRYPAVHRHPYLHDRASFGRSGPAGRNDGSRVGRMSIHQGSA